MGLNRKELHRGSCMLYRLTVAKLYSPDSSTARRTRREPGDIGSHQLVLNVCPEATRSDLG